MKRSPDFIIGNGYLRRWYIIPRNPFFNIYLHEFLGSDDDRALHDHPWFNLSIVLKGYYIEHTVETEKQRQHFTSLGVPDLLGYYRGAGDFKFRAPWTAHRLEVPEPPCWTLFITGPRIREWGFLCPAGWRHWTKFVSTGDRGQVGPGCN